MAELTAIADSVGRIYDNIDSVEHRLEDQEGGPYVVDIRECLIVAPYYVKDSEGDNVSHGVFLYSTGDEFQTEGILSQALRKVQRASI